MSETLASGVQPLPNEFLSLPLPEPSEFRVDRDGKHISGTLGEAFELTAQVADAFGARPRTVHRIRQASDKLADNLQYAHLVGAALESAYTGDPLPIEPAHISPVLNAQERKLPWKVRDAAYKYGVSPGDELPTTFILGGLRASLETSEQAKRVLTQIVGAPLEKVTPYANRYGSFESAPVTEIRSEVSTLLGFISEGARFAANQRRINEGKYIDPAKIAKDPDHYVERVDVGNAIRQTVLDMLMGQIELPMATAIMGDILQAMRKDPASKAEEISKLDPRIFEVGAYRIIRIFNAFLLPDQQNKKLQDLAGDASIKALAAAVLPGKAGGKFRALAKVPRIVRAAMRVMPTDNRQINYPVEVMTALTDPKRRTLAGSPAGSIALRAA